MIKFPSEAETAHRDAQWLDGLGIEAACFDGTLSKIAESGLKFRAVDRGGIICACHFFHLRMVEMDSRNEIIGRANLKAIRRAKRQVEKLGRRLKNVDDTATALAELLRLREDWTGKRLASVLPDLDYPLYDDLCGELRTLGITVTPRFTDRGFDLRDACPEDGSIRERLATGCDAVIKFWSETYSLKPGRRQLPVRDWILHMAYIYKGAGGRLQKNWAYWSDGLGRYDSPFCKFLWQVYEILPRRCDLLDRGGACRTSSEAALADYVARTGKAVRRDKTKLDQPYYF